MKNTKKNTAPFRSNHIIKSLLLTSFLTAMLGCNQSNNLEADDLNIAISKLIEERNKKETDLNKVTQERSTLEQEKNQVEVEKATIQTQLEAANNDKNTLQTKITKLKQKIEALKTIPMDSSNPFEKKEWEEKLKKATEELNQLKEEQKKKKETNKKKTKEEKQKEQEEKQQTKAENEQSKTEGGKQTEEELEKTLATTDGKLIKLRKKIEELEKDKQAQSDVLKQQHTTLTDEEAKNVKKVKLGYLQGKVIAKKEDKEELERQLKLFTRQLKLLGSKNPTAADIEIRINASLAEFKKIQDEIANGTKEENKSQTQLKNLEQEIQDLRETQELIKKGESKQTLQAKIEGAEKERKQIEEETATLQKELRKVKKNIVKIKCEVEKTKIKLEHLSTDHAEATKKETKLKEEAKITQEQLNSIKNT